MRSLANVLGWSAVAAFLFLVFSADDGVRSESVRRADPLCCEQGDDHSQGCASCAVMEMVRRPFDEKQALRVERIKRELVAKRKAYGHGPHRPGA